MRMKDEGGPTDDRGGEGKNSVWKEQTAMGWNLRGAVGRGRRGQAASVMMMMRGKWGRWTKAMTARSRINC